MTDEQLAQYLGIENEACKHIIIAGMDQVRRSVYERMAQIETELELWQAGLGPKPQGVLIDEDRKRKRKNRC